MAPLPSTANVINIHPGPDADRNYLYDFGAEVVGSTGAMTFQIENDPSAVSDLTVAAVYIEDTTGPFAVTDAPSFPASVAPGESVSVEVTFEPGAEGFFEGMVRILSDASNIPQSGDISYNLRGMAISPSSRHQRN